jgi:hypothetical protein
MKSLTLIAVSLVILTSIAAVAIVASSPQNSQSDDQITTDPPKPLNSIMEIKQDFFNLHEAGVPEMTIDDVEIYAYYGTYNGCVVLDIGCKYLLRITLYSYEFEGLVMPGLAIAWKNGEFYNIPDAYERGLLTKDNLREVCAIFFTLTQ